jgi:hypothetical protein
VEIQGEHAFVVAFMYEETGDPIWYFTAGPMSSPTRFEGDWLEFSGGQTLAGPYRPPAAPRNLGRVTIDFVAADDATIAFTESALAKGHAKRVKSGNGRTTRGQPQFPAPTWNDHDDFWPTFNCTVDVAIHTEDSVNHGNDLPSVYTLDEKWKYVANFHLAYDTATGRGHYSAGTGSYVDYSYESHDTHNGCRGHRSALRRPISGDFVVRPDLGYKGCLGDGFGLEVTETADSCLNVQSQPPPVPVHIPLTARIGNNYSKIQSPTSFHRGAGGYPYMRTVDTLRLDDGVSTGSVTVNCKAAP